MCPTEGKTRPFYTGKCWSLFLGPKLFRMDATSWGDHWGSRPTVSALFQDAIYYNPFLPSTHPPTHSFFHFFSSRVASQTRLGTHATDLLKLLLLFFFSPRAHLGPFSVQLQSTNPQKVSTSSNLSWRRKKALATIGQNEERTMALQDTDKYRGKQLLNSRTFNPSYFCYCFLLKRVMIYFENGSV